MPQKYNVTKSDYIAAKKYLTRKLNEDFEWFEESPAGKPGSMTDAKSEFWDTDSTESLNSWAEKWLSTDQWDQLKTAIRAARKRKRDQKDPEGGSKHISLTRKAWVILRDLAKHENMSISAFVVKRLEKEWLKLKAGEDQSL